MCLSHAPVERLCPEGSGGGDYPDISKVCYLRCKKAIDRLLESKGSLRFRKLQAEDVTMVMMCF